MHCWVMAVAKAGGAMPADVVAHLAAPRDDLPFPVATTDRWWSTDRRVAYLGWSGHATSLGVGAFVHLGRASLTAFSGHVWVDDRPWASGVTWAEQLARTVEDLDPARDHDRLGGVFTLVRVRADGTGWVTADPLGLGAVYVAERDDVAIVSNRAALAAAFGARSGAPATRDLDAMGLLALTGAIPGTRTGFTGVEVLPQASVLRLDPAVGLRVDTWARQPWWPDERLDLDAAVEQAARRLERRIGLLAGTPAHRATCELTGGKDSRLVLGLLLAGGLAGEVTFRTWGPSDLPDVVVARALADAYDLDLRVDGAGPRREGERSLRPRPEDRDGWAVADVGAEALLRHHVWASSGALSTWNLYRPIWPPASGVSLTGLAGEVLSTNHVDTDRIRSEAMLRRFIRRGGLGYGAAGILAPDAAEHAADLVVAEVLAARAPGADLADAIDGYYQSGRLRRWAGGNLELDSRHRVLPLYDLEVLRSAFAIGSERRRAELLKHHLIARCDPDLVRWPFAAGGWSSAIADDDPEHPLPRKRRSTSLPLALDVALRPHRQRLRQRDLGLLAAAARRRRRAPDVAERNRMADVERTRTTLRTVLDLPPGHVVWDLYDRRRTLAAVDRLDHLTSQGRADVHHAATVAIWLDRGEERGAPFVRVDELEGRPGLG